ncbi:bifunctional diguanylate cyclase/phosphodiesterase [Roseibium sp. MMSF_3544]|uniref:putative bifunctional diguanylate cyclase/phosphodiesterase n=1 Tax=unclassified Roseibium TaxID=2629323 RepID=UPI00273FEE49|nr:EAL domain-containing protein [Roseibium sp. MMSF_3544]
MIELLAAWPVQYLFFGIGAGVILFPAVFFVGRRISKQSASKDRFEFGNDAAILKTVVEHAHEGLVVQDIYGRIEWSNPAYSRITGYSAEEIRGRRPQEFILPPDKQLAPDEIENFKFDLGKFSSGFKELILNRRKNGEFFWNQLTFAQVEGDTPDKAKMIILCQDVTREVERFAELEETRKRLKYQAEHDELTGLATRARMTSFLQDRLSSATDKDAKVGIIHFDLDHFKDINDSHGHSAGDAVLRHVADVLKTVFKDFGLVARVGGDEFVAVVSKPDGPEQMEHLAQRIFDSLTRPIMVERHRLMVAGSVGLVLADAGKTSLAEIVNRADIALYAAKKAGRGRFSWYTEALGAAHRHRRMSMAQLDHDLEKGRLTLLMEPQYSLADRRITGYEVSPHWLHPSEGLVDPTKLLSVQEDMKRIAQVERFALQHGLSEIKRLRDAANVPLSMSVNLTAASFGEHGIESRLESLCEEADVAFNDLILEFDQQIIRFDEPGSLQKAIERLSGIGCRIALDEVGSGHGGAGQLIRLSAHLLKLSPWLVGDLETDVNKQYLAQSIINLAGKFEFQVMAVGVDTPGQLEILKDLGCQFIQGAMISTPLSPREAELHLHEFSGRDRLP